jgi:hypothetical protein
MPVMVEVGGLDRVHRAHRPDAERKLRELSGASTDAQRVVIRVVDLAKARQKEEERTHERHRREARMNGVRKMPRPRR